MGKTYWCGLLLSTLAWGVLSIAAAYPDFILEHNLDMFVSQKDDFLEKLIIPALLFLAIFTLDLFVTIKEVEATQKRWDAIIFVIFTFFLFFLFFLFTIKVDYSCAKIVGFFCMWIHKCPNK